MSTNPTTKRPAAQPDSPQPSRGIVIDQAALRWSAGLLLGGQLLYILITQFHAGGDANDHREIFIHYAGSGDWKGVHVGQFAAMTVIVAGLVVFGSALKPALKGRATAAMSAVAKSASMLAGVALALYAALQAVDGVGNQQVDAAWEHATGADKTARFASAEAMRWLEWGMRSYHGYALGLALIGFAVAAAAVGRPAVPKGVAWLMGASGVAYLAQGWVVGTQGFSVADSNLIVAAWALSLAWMGWLVAATRRKSTQPRLTHVNTTGSRNAWPHLNHYPTPELEEGSRCCGCTRRPRQRSCLGRRLTL